MSAEAQHEPAAAARVVEDVVCTGCGCLCDDIAVYVQGDRILEARNACPIGAAKFLGYRPEPGPACLVDGMPAPFDEGVERAARLLADARYPVIFGLADVTSEAQRAAVSLADRIGACIDSAVRDRESSVQAALQSIGEVTCTLGEVRNRADLVIVWRTDPIESHPRLFSRYALDPVGTFLPGGRGDRYCAIVNVRESRSVQEVADQFIAIKEEGEAEALWILRALALGISLDPAAVESATGARLATWEGLMDRMKAARYGALFYEAGHSVNGRRLSIPHAIHSLVRDMNALTRFVAMPLGGPGNLAGARNVLTWRTGYPSAVNLARGHPRHGPREFSAEMVLRRQHADAALIVSGDPTSGLTEAACEHLGRIPCIVLGSEGPIATRNPAVFFRTAVFGISTPGTVYRMDGVPLPLRGVLASAAPSPEGVLRAIGRRMGPLDERAGAVPTEAGSWR